MTQDEREDFFADDAVMFGAHAVRDGSEQPKPYRGTQGGPVSFACDCDDVRPPERPGVVNMTYRERWEIVRKELTAVERDAALQLDLRLAAERERDELRIRGDQWKDAALKAEAIVARVEALADEWGSAPNPSPVMRGFTGLLRAALKGVDDA